MNNQKPPVRKMDMGVLKRVLGILFRAYPGKLTAAVLCMLLSSVAAAFPAVFQQQIIALIEEWMPLRDWTGAAAQILPKLGLLIVLYIFSLVFITAYTQLMAVITQSFLDTMRKSTFSEMQDLPIGYFDTHKHGDIMSHYTNDIDTLRMFVGQSLPAIIRAGVLVLCVFMIMLYYSLWLTLVVLLGVVFMMLITKKVGGGSARYFMKNQQSIGRLEGYVQEIMNGQKVVKVFCREEACSREFEDVNTQMFDSSFRAHAYANCLGPIIANTGNILYVLIATVGGLLLAAGVKNPCLRALQTGGATILTIDIIVPFLSMTKQFTGNINQISQQVNSIVMAMAGAKRVFELMDEQPETDEGYVTLVNCRRNEDGTISETSGHTGLWAWKHPHTDGTLTYQLLEGDVRLEKVDFAYVPGKDVLHDITLYAKPGQKVAFVGATGAGKTTITNLINRFYDIEDGKIRYDGININKIRKKDLRRSLGLVLQDVNLFTGTVLENIRYGKLDATRQECERAARLAGAHDFITRLPKGYDTMLENNGANLSQGQRQLISIARAAVADPPVMILDEATSSIDTRTEAIVQKGMDELMKGRTVFVIAHRLSTVMNSDVILVLDHGEIIERGTHEQLIEQGGVYCRLYQGAFELE